MKYLWHFNGPNGKRVGHVFLETDLKLELKGKEWLLW